MSISYQFTSYGTLRVRCGDEWSEIVLPGSYAETEPTSVPSETDKGTPKESGEPTNPPVQIGKPVREPLRPGTMAVVVGARGIQPDPSWMYVTPDAFDHESVMELKHLVESLRRPVKRGGIGHVERVGLPSPRPRILDVALPLGTGQPVELSTEIIDAISEQEHGISAVRFLVTRSKRD